MRILALDPGHTETAWLIYDSEQTLPVDFGYDKNEEVLRRISQEASNLPIFSDIDVLVIEWISSYGMQVGQEIFRTCLWVGRFIERWPGKHELIIRPDIKIYLCNNRSAKDKFVREALIFKFGNSAEEAIGKRLKPGPLYGIAGDVWSALAAAVTYAERPKGEGNAEKKMS